jgi:hypothetical protein
MTIKIPFPNESRPLHQGPSPASFTEGEASRVPGGPAACARFFQRRWRGEAPLAGVFWNDMLLAGTIVNVTSTLLAVLLLTTGASTPLVAVVHFSPLPLNVFLVVAVWRSAESAAGTVALAARMAALAWLLAATAL